MNGWETCRAAMNLAAAEYWATGNPAVLVPAALGLIVVGLVVGYLAAWVLRR